MWICNCVQMPGWQLPALRCHSECCKGSEFCGAVYPRLQERSGGLQGKLESMQGEVGAAHAAADAAQERVRSLERARDALQRQKRAAEEEVRRLHQGLDDVKVRLCPVPCAAWALTKEMPISSGRALVLRIVSSRSTATMLVRGSAPTV